MKVCSCKFIKTVAAQVVLPDTVDWTPPEVVCGGAARIGKSTDVYAYLLIRPTAIRPSATGPLVPCSLRRAR